MKEAVKKIRDLIGVMIGKRVDMYLAAAATLILFILLAVGSRHGIETDLKKGDIVAYDILLPEDVEVIDQVRTEEKNEQIRKEIAPVFVRDRNIGRQALKDADSFFSEATRIQNNENLSGAEKIDAIMMIRTNIGLERRDMARLISSQDMRNDIRDVLSMIYDRGYLQVYEMYSAVNFKAMEIQDKDTGAVIMAEPGNFHTPETLEIRSIITQTRKGLDQASLGSMKAFILYFLKPDIKYDIQKTAGKMDDAIKRADPVFKGMKKGKVILYRGEEITKEKLGLIKEINRLIKYGSLPGFVAVTLAFLALFGMGFLALRTFEPRTLQLRNIFYLLLSLMASCILAAYGASALESAFNPGLPKAIFIPVALAVLTFPVFFGMNFSLVMVAIVSISSGFILKGDFVSNIFVLLTGFSAVIAGRRFNQRKNYWLQGLMVVAIGAFFTVLDGLFNFFSMRQILRACAFNASVGLVSVFLGLGLIGLFEHVFNACTDARLLELSDLNKPIFKKMLMEASGTYHHSILTANLAEAAALEIGANSLVAKVAACYHDIGKLENPDFFIENSSRERLEELEKLKPSFYVSVVKRHLRGSVDEGRRLRLPFEVLEAVSQHHGKGLIKFFYYKALNSAKGGEQMGLRREDFTYDGENPKSREAVILLLADCCEAASRTLPNPSFAGIKEMTEKILNGKFAEGLLSDGDVTLGEIKKIGEAFIRVLVGVFHTRISYPDDREIRDAEQGL